MSRWDDAISEADQLLAHDPTARDVRYLLGASLLGRSRHDLGDLRRADEVASSLVADEPEWAYTYLLLGDLRAEQNHMNPAIEALETAIRLAPWDAYSHARLAELQLRLYSLGPQRRSSLDRRLAPALASAAEAVRLAPDDPTGYLVMAQIHLARREPGQARISAQEGLRLDPEHPGAHQTLGLVAQQEGDGREAARHFVDAGRLDPTSDTSISLLRDMTETVPWPLWLVAVGLLVAQSPAGLIMIGIFGYRTVKVRRQRRDLSAEARNVLEQDGRLNAKRSVVDGLGRLRRRQRRRE